MCSALLLLLSACATMQPGPRLQAEGSLRLANLQRTAALPWKDEGRCVVQEASQPWPVLVERCFKALDQDRIQFNDPTGKCAVASVGAAALGLGVCVLAAPEIAVGAVIVIGAVVVAAAIAQELDAYRRRGPVEPEAGRRAARPALQPQSTAQEPLAKRRPKPEPAEGSDWPPPLPPEPLDRERRRRCEAIPVPHLGGDDAHNQCADTFPPNRYPGMDVLVDGKHFDALQVWVRVLWEIKTDQFDTYNDFLRNQVIEDQVEEMREERDIAQACGYDFVVGVSSAAHREALEFKAPDLKIVVTGCKR